jgi:hypothetical protein
MWIKKRRTLWLAAICAAAVLPASAQSQTDLMAALTHCAAIADNSERLACYDKLAPQVKTVADAPPPPPEASVPTPSQGSVLDSLNPFSGGSDAAPSAAQMSYQAPGQEILPVTIGVSAYEVAPSGSFTVTLDNRQVWRERNEHFDTPPFRKDGKNVVMIERGLLGGFNLYLKGMGKIYKVMRIK